jgi:preprotein translocase subunit YajC
MSSQDFIDSLLSLVPPVLVGGIFYLIMRGILRADRTERKVYAEMEAKMRAAQAQSEQPTNAKK